VKNSVLIARATAAAAVIGLLAALAASTASAATPAPCPAQTIVRPFLPWGDSNNYFLAPEGSMESTSTWSLSNASRVTDNEPFHVNSPLDKSALSLGSSGSATTAPICVTVHSPTLRLFVRNLGSPTSALRVDVLFTNKYGLPAQAPVTYLTSGSSWSLSSEVSFLKAVTTAVNANDQTWVRFRFTPVGWGGNWRLDDLFVDPLKGV